jgi:hypothetical protein
MMTWRRMMQSGDGVMMGGGATPQPPVGRTEEQIVIQKRDISDDDGDENVRSSKGKLCKPRQA